MFEALLILAAASAPQSADPLAEARAGKVQCVTPNRDNKTCMALVSYTVRADGTYDSTTTMLIVPTPLVTMEIRATGKTDGNKVCNMIRKADFEAATLAMDGGPVNAAMEQAIRTQVTASIAPFDGKTGCATEKADGDIRISEAAVDGVARPELNQRFIWVKAEDGYKVGQ